MDHIEPGTRARPPSERETTVQHRRILTIAAGLTAIATLGVSPQLAAGAVPPTPQAGIDAQVWPVDALVAFPVNIPAPVVADPVPTTTPQPVPAAPAAQDTASIDIGTPAVATAEAVAPAVPAGSIRVEVAAADGASRSVSLQRADGTPVSGPVEVTGDPITFDDLEAGTYDLFVEHAADGGGTFLTRTVIDIDGDAAVARCDAETLDCTVD